MSLMDMLQKIPAGAQRLLESPHSAYVMAVFVIAVVCVIGVSTWIVAQYRQAQAMQQQDRLK